MKVALVGSSGYISGFLLKMFSEDSSIESVLRIDQVGDVDVVLDLLHPEQFDYSVLKEVDFVVFTAAISGPDKCASDFDWCWDINVTGTKFFIENAIKLGCRVLFFSSDAVFGDISGEVYSELSETRAETPYGRMKKEIEDCFKENELFKAIRLSYVVSAKDRFVSYCIQCMKEGKDAEIFHPFYRNCISVTDVVDVVMWFLKNWERYKPSFLNVAGKELVSRVRIADELNRIYSERLKYVIVSPNEDFYKNRPKTTQIESLYLQKYNIIKDASFTEKIKRELEDFKL